MRKNLMIALPLLLFSLILATRLDAGEVKSLFNGKDLSGWTVYITGRGSNDVKGVFSVEEGILHISGEEHGGIMTEDSFAADYRLTLEFKWGTKAWGKRKDRARDSGVLIHSYGDPDGFAGVWAKSVEANIVEGGIGDFWMVTGKEDGDKATCEVVVKDGVKIFDPVHGEPFTVESNSDHCFGWFGRDPNWEDVYGFRGANDIDRPDDWNELCVIARGSTMEVYLNGTLVNRVYNLTRSEGKIQLQSEGAEIFYRNIRIEKLD